MFICFAFVPSVACVRVEFHPRPAQSRQFGGLFRCDVHRHHRALHILRCAIPNQPPQLTIYPQCILPYLKTPGLPIALRVIYADRFTRGPFHLGRLSYPIASAAVLWIAFISIVFCLPELAPVNSQTLNYAPVAVGIVLTYALGFWAVSARRWFAGPIKQIAGKWHAPCPSPCSQRHTTAIWIVGMLTSGRFAQRKRWESM